MAGEDTMLACSRRNVLHQALGTAALAVGGAGGCGGALPAPRGSLPPTALRVEKGRFVRAGRPFFMAGMNYWAALPMARSSDGALDGRVLRSLDALSQMGINTLRILGATEGPDSEPWRIVPALQPEQGRYDDASVRGLVRLIEEIERRGMYAIVGLNNFWPWSGGMAQYVSWAEGSRIPYPPPAEGGDWSAYQAYAAKFYSNVRARAAFRAFVELIVPKLSRSPAVIWELANEPRGIDAVDAYNDWIVETAALLKRLSPDQLVTTGSEGETPAPGRAGLDVLRNHASAYIDFVTCHLWAQNWGWVWPETLAADLPKARELADAYLVRHAMLAQSLGKPLVLEEFGFPRDGGSFDPSASVRLRDVYFDAVYRSVYALMGKTTMAGIFPWAWAGNEVPPRPGDIWKPGDPFTGDPPHERAGWYSIYSGDSTVALLRDWSTRIAGFAAC